MYTCLSCKTPGKVRSEGRYCPNCWEEVRTFTGKDGTKLWVPIGEDAPPTQLLKFWLKETSERMSADQGYRVSFNIHPMRQRQQYMAEVAMSGHLLMVANWDTDVAKEALRKVVHNPTKKVPVTLAWVREDFNAMMAIVLGERAQQKNSSEEHTKRALEGQEDVWT